MNERAQSLGERKRRLIAAGAAYRDGIVEARRQVGANLQAESLAKKAIGQLALGAFAVIRGGKAGGVNAGGIQALLPLALSGISLLSKKTAARPALRRVVLAGVAGVLVALLAKRKLGQWRQARQDSGRSKRRA